MNWLEWLGVLEIIQLAIIFGICVLFWMFGNAFRGGKEDETDSRYYVHGVIGPEFRDVSGVEVEHGRECDVDPASALMARRRVESSRTTDYPFGVPDGRITANQVLLLADHRLRHGGYDHSPDPAFYIIDKLRERADADRAARRARQASAGGVGNGADIAAPSGRPAMAGDAAHSDLCLVRHNDEGDEG